jgi:mycofactocin precursor
MPLPPPDQTPAEPQPEGQELVEEDLLVEDVSIDGMCGVY